MPNPRHIQSRAFASGEARTEYKHRANIEKGVWIGKPLLGFYSDDESDDGPYLADFIVESKRKAALKAADVRALRIDKGLEGMDLGPLPMTLGDAGDWLPPLDLTFDNNRTRNATGLEAQLGSLTNSAIGVKDEYLALEGDGAALLEAECPKLDANPHNGWAGGLSDFDDAEHVNTNPVHELDYSWAWQFPSTLPSPEF